MAVLKKGKYLGKYKDGELSYHAFYPETIAVNGKTLYVRNGDRQEEFPTNRSYMIRDNFLTEEEKLLIEERKNNKDESI